MLTTRETVCKMWLLGLNFPTTFILYVVTVIWQWLHSPFTGTRVYQYQKTRETVCKMWLLGLNFPTTFMLYVVTVIWQCIHSPLTCARVYQYQHWYMQHYFHKYPIFPYCKYHYNRFIHTTILCLHIWKYKKTEVEFYSRVFNVWSISLKCNVVRARRDSICFSQRTSR